MYIFISGTNGSAASGIRDQRVWSIQECGNVFENSLACLKVDYHKQGENAMLVWDKVSYLIGVPVHCT